MVKILFRMLKINHYIKNIIVIIPLCFSISCININLCISSLKMFISFCLMSSCIYILNDLIDIDYDKRHPTKCFRPIASGQISTYYAVIILLILFFMSILVASLVNLYSLAIILIYFSLNILYSFYLKKIVIIDVACIAFSFVLRLIAGYIAIKVMPSILLIFLTFFTSMFFTFAKRRMELQLVGKINCRSAVKFLNLKIIDKFILINAILSIVLYIFYTINESTIINSGSKYLYLTTFPFSLMIFRLFYLINTSNQNDDPVIFMVDKKLKLLSVFYIVIFALSYLL